MALAMPVLASPVADVETGRASRSGFDGTADQGATVYNSVLDGPIDRVRGDDRPHDAETGRAVPPHMQIDVRAKVLSEDGPKHIYVKVEWGDMKFAFNRSNSSWNPLTHTYATVSGQWLANNSAVNGGTPTEFYLDVDRDDTHHNNKIVITNHSNTAVNAQLSYNIDGSVGNRFNAVPGADNVVGGFYGSPEEALAGAAVLTNPRAIGTGYNTLGSYLAAEQSNVIPLHTAVGRERGTPATLAVTQQEAWFAFSGTPDANAAFASFTKVGFITVTITPNNDDGPNTPGSWFPTP